MSDSKSCFNCAHLKTWSYSATREEPSDEGWECGHPNSSDFPYEDIQPDRECSDCKGTGFVDCDYGSSVDVNAAWDAGGFVNAEQCSCWDESNDEVKAAWDAKNCLGYLYKDWDDYPGLSPIEALLR